MSGEIRLVLYVGATEWGGAEVVVAHLLSGLGAHVHPVLVGVDAEVLGRIAEGRPGTEVVRVPKIRGRRDVRAILAHRRALARLRADVVQLNLPVPFSEPWTLLAATTLRRARVVVVEHLPMAIGSRNIRALRRLTTRRVAAQVAVGAGAARELEALGGRPPGSVRVIWNGVPRPQGGGDAVRPEGAALVVAGIGRLHAQKGFDVLLRAAARLPGVHVVLVGDGPEREALGELAEELGLTGRVTTTGWVDRPSSWYAAADVVAMPSRFEGLPLVLLEAMLAGTPVVATDVGSIGDAVRDGETGLVVPVDDVEALADALRRLADDVALRDRLAAAAVEVAERRFTVEAMARSYEALYDEVLGRR